ncbi:MAG: MBL fold metallo-hydrolase [Candidatus Latescibacteria bacterium]|nr:MBL fold metallo-hydrolase [Candidatus Latescibacterota bacterium]
MLHINDALPDLNLFLLTHLHGDHYDPEVIQLIARRKRTTFILPEPVMSRVIEETGLREDQILPIREGECRQFAGGTIEAYQVPHGGVKCNFGYLLETEGKRIVFSSDIRDYSTGWLPNLGNVDLLCLNLWLGRDQGLKFSLHVVEEACQFIASIRPRRVLFYHLYEVSRTPENGWTYVHAGLVQDRLLTLAPEIRCYAPYWGEGVTI